MGKLNRLVSLGFVVMSGMLVVAVVNATSACRTAGPTDGADEPDVETLATQLHALDAGSGRATDQTLVDVSTDASVETELSAKEFEEKCLADGGQLKRDGVLGHMGCDRPYEDAGKRCRDSSECRGECRAKVAWGRVGAGEVGGCQNDDNLFGCRSEIINGKRTSTICVD